MSTVPANAAGGGESLTLIGDLPNRIVALMIDIVILSLLAFLAAVAVSLALGPAVSFDPAAGSIGGAIELDRGVATIDAVVSLLVSAVYFAGSWALWGRTAGQRLLALRVVEADSGERAGLGRSLVRWLLLAAPFGVVAIVTTAFIEAGRLVPDVLLIGWYLLLLLTTAVGAESRGLHDRVSGTAVTKRISPGRLFGNAGRR